jgi:3'-phosphoadenosine 5'-phosphosulfate sulfotransferase (PAPS reductase)/FAD synthetase
VGPRAVLSFHNSNNPYTLEKFRINYEYLQKFKKKLNNTLKIILNQNKIRKTINNTSSNFGNFE